jgi:hypothetical protein
MPILDAVGDGMTFRPNTHRQFIVLNISRRFDDLGHLRRYLSLCTTHSGAELLAAARDAEGLDRSENRIEHFFNTLRGAERTEAS